MPNAAGWQSHLWFKKESTWGTGVTPDIWTPFNQYGVLAQFNPFRGNTYLGVRQQRHPPMPLNTPVAGPLALDFYGYQVTSGSKKSIAQHLIDEAVSAPAGLELGSFTFEQYDPNDSKRHTGVRINSMEISGSADGPVTLSFDLVAKQEASATPPSLVATTPHYKPAMFRDCTFSLGGVATELRSFRLRLENNLQTKFNNSQWASLILAGRRMWSFSFTLFKTANTYDALRRASTVTDRTAQLTIQADHHGTGAPSTAYSKATFDIDLSNFLGATENFPLDDIWEQSVDYMILKPSTTDNDVDITWSDVA